MRVVNNKSSNTLGNTELDFFIGLVVAVIKDVLWWEPDRQRGVKLAAAEAVIVSTALTRVVESAVAIVSANVFALVAEVASVAVTV